MRRERVQRIGRHQKQRRTIELIRQLIEQGKRDEAIRAQAAELVQDIPEGDWQGEIQAIIDFIKDEVRYTRDPYMIESVSDAKDTLELGYGDCDDYTVLAGSMLEAIGHPVRLKVVGRNQLSHIFPEAFVKGKGWQPVDCARPRDKAMERRSWPIEQTIELNDFGGNMPKLKKQIRQARSVLATMSIPRVNSGAMLISAPTNRALEAARDNLVARLDSRKGKRWAVKAQPARQSVTDVIVTNERPSVADIIAQLNARAQARRSAFVLPSGVVFEKTGKKKERSYNPAAMKYNVTGDFPEKGFGDYGGGLDLTSVTKMVTGAVNLIPGGAAVTGMVDPAMIYGPKAAQRATRYGLTVEEAYQLRHDLDKFEKAGVTDPAVIRMGWDQYNAKLKAGYSLTPAPKMKRQKLALGQKYTGKKDNTLLYVGAGLLGLLAVVGMGKKK